MLRPFGLDELDVHDVTLFINFFYSDGVFGFAVGQEHESFLEWFTAVKNGIESLLREFFTFENDFELFLFVYLAFHGLHQVLRRGRGFYLEGYYFFGQVFDFNERVQLLFRVVLKLQKFRNSRQLLLFSHAY